MQNIMSTEYNERFSNEFSEEAKKYLLFDSIVNRKNKVTFYNELATKTFILSNTSLFKGIDTLLTNDKLWYNEGKVIDLLDNLKAIEMLKRQINQEDDFSQKCKLNGEIKRMIEEIKNNE